MLGFIIGLFVGAFLGVALMCLCNVASKSDEQMDKYYKNNMEDEV